jgi:hypothetical protein
VTSAPYFVSTLFSCAVRDGFAYRGRGTASPVGAFTSRPSAAAKSAPRSCREGCVARAAATQLNAFRTAFDPRTCRCRSGSTSSGGGLRGELRDHELVGRIDEQVLAVNAHANNEQGCTAVLDVPLRAIVHGRDPDRVLDERARVPRRRCRRSARMSAIQLSGMICREPRAPRSSMSWPTRGEVTRCHTHAPRAARGAQTVDRDVGAFCRAHGLPDELAHEIGDALAPMRARRPSRAGPYSRRCSGSVRRAVGRLRRGGGRRSADRTAVSPGASGFQPVDLRYSMIGPLVAR